MQLAMTAKTFRRQKLENTTRKPQIFYYDLDMKKLDEIKNDYSKNEENISINDVLHYWVSTLKQDYQKYFFSFRLGLYH